MSFYLMMNRWTMIKRHTLIVILISILASIAIWLNAFNKKQNNIRSVKALTFHTFGGWGYNILVNDTLFIHQATIPGINGMQGFSKREQAEKTAQLIINKIKKGESPIVTIFDLQKIIPVNDIRQ